MQSYRAVSAMPNSLPSFHSQLPIGTPFPLEKIREKLARHIPGQLEDSAHLKHAAVALILRETDNGAEILIIGRAEHPDDPWSGHLGFPGGRVEPSDESPERAAVRETEEELGVLLDSCTRRIGALSELRARAQMQFIPMSIFPFVYELVEPIVLHKSDEVAMASWIPVGFFLGADNRTTMPHPVHPERVLPCYKMGERIFWGLSLTMLDELLEGFGVR